LDASADFHSGTIFVGAGSPLWKFQSGRPSERSFKNPFGTPVFRLTDSNDAEVAAIQRETLIPSKFRMSTPTGKSASIRLRSVIPTSAVI